MKLCPTFNLFAATALVSASVLIGCDNADQPAATPAAPTMGATNDAAKNAAADMKATAESTNAQVMDAATTGQAAVTDAGNAMVDQAKKVYDQATAAIGQMKMDDAQKYFDQLKGMRDKLPADWQTKIDELGKMITDAKAKMGATPAMPAMPK